MASLLRDMYCIVFILFPFFVFCFFLIPMRYGTSAIYSTDCTAYLSKQYSGQWLSQICTAVSLAVIISKLLSKSVTVFFPPYPF